MPSLEQGMVRDAVRTLERDSLTVSGIQEWMKRNDVSVPEYIRCDGEYSDSEPCCLLWPHCDGRLRTYAENLHIEIWDLIHAQNLNTNVDGPKKPEMFPGTALTWHQFHRASHVAVSAFTLFIVSSKEWKTKNRGVFGGTTANRKRSGSQRFETWIAQIVRRHKAELLEHINVVLASLVTSTFRVEATACTSKAADIPAKADFAIQLKFSFVGLGYEEMHNIPVNVKATAANGHRQEIEAGGASMLSWALTKESISNSSEYMAALPEALADPALEGKLSDYFFAHFAKDDPDQKPFVTSLLTINPTGGGVRFNRARKFPHLGLHVSKAIYTQRLTSTVGQARRELAAYFNEQQIRYIVEQMAYAADLKKVLGNDTVDPLLQEIAADASAAVNPGML